jgi:hypothetical protein
MNVTTARAIASLFVPVSTPRDYYARCKVCETPTFAILPGGLILNQRAHLRAHHPRRYVRAILTEVAANDRAAKTDDPWKGTQ